ncbi:MAG TPA: TonB-dependent receptor [Acidobacteriota bacterium]|nr:TonB-dependent receptor [Acidobacteriota bacterium]
MTGWKKAFLALTILLFTCGFVLSEENKKSDKKKDEKETIFHPHEKVLVTATMSRHMIKDCSSSVSVIDIKDIQALPGVSNAMNLLNDQQGIFIRQTGMFGRADVDIRGIGQRGRRIAVLVDGRPEKMGLYGCTVTHAFPLDNVERIEVVRGPSSVLYGSEAVGGVVNILTHMPENKFETDFTGSYGSYNTQQYNLRHGGNFHRFSYFLTMDKRSSDGHRENSGYKGNALTGKVQYKWAENLISSFQVKYFDGKKYEAGSLDYPLSDFWNDYKRSAADFSLRKNNPEDEIFLKLYSNFGHHRFSDGWHSRDYVNGGVVRYTSKHIANNELTIGGDFRFLGGKSYNFPQGEWQKNEQAVFVHDQYVLWKKWILSTGLRLHRDSVYGLQLSPQWGVVYQINDSTSIRGNISKGFRSPQLNELYMFPAANPELEPEILWNYELGFKKNLFSWLILDGNCFHMKGSNFIETQPNDSPPPLFQFRNTGKFVFSGIEAALRASINQNLSFRLFYTYLDAGEKTKGRPGHKTDLSLRWEESSYFVSLQGQYVTDYYAGDFSTRPLPSYFLLNTRMGFNISQKVKIFLDINNLLNKNYNIFVDLPGIASGVYPMPGRNLNLGIKIIP